MTPRAARGVGKTSPLLAERLSLLFFLVFRLVNHPCSQDTVVFHPQTGATVAQVPRWIAYLRESKIPPFWREETCPTQYAAKWGEHWANIRAAWAEEAVPHNTKQKNLQAFDWNQSPALALVAKVNKKEKWDSILHPLFETILAELGRTVRDVWVSGEQWDDGVPQKRDWDTKKGEIFDGVFGPKSSKNGIHWPSPIETYWSNYISGQLDATKKSYDRSRTKLPTIRQRLDELLGDDWLHGGESAALQFKIEKCRRAMTILRQYQDALSWMLLTDAEIESLTVNVDTNPVALKEHYVSLSQNSQTWEWCGRALGWMAGLIKARWADRTVKVPDIAPEMEAAFARGNALADLIPDQLRAQLQEGQEHDVAQYMEEVDAFADMWMGRTPEDDDFCDILDGSVEKQLEAWEGGGCDIGNEMFKGQAPQMLIDYLGLPDDGIPPILRHHIAEDPTVYQRISDVAIASTTEPLELGYHQLQAVAVVMTKMRDPTLAAETTMFRPGEDTAFAPLALAENWSRVPGVLIADEVGLGKTLTMLAIIGTIVHLRELQLLLKARSSTGGPAVKLPQCLGEKWGSLDEIPDAPHLIVVPLKLLKQTEIEIQRFVNLSKMALVVVRPGKHYTAQDVPMVRKSGKPLYRTIVLTTNTVIKKMASEGVSVSGEHRLPRVNFPLAVDNLFTFSFATTSLDEVHEYRTGGVQHKAVHGLSMLSQLTMGMTATPLVEGVKDILFLARLLGPPTLTPYNFNVLWDKIALLGRAKNLVRARDMTALMSLNEGSATFATSESREQTQREAADALAIGIVKSVQSHLLPLMLRRTGRSVDHENKCITLALPPITILHLLTRVTQAEEDGGALFEVDEDKSYRKVERATLTLHGAFYSRSRAHISMPCGTEPPIRPLTCHNAGQPLSKMAALSELIIRMLRLGPMEIVPPKFHGTSAEFVGQEILGIPAVHVGENYKPTILPPDFDSRGTQIIVYTLLAQFQPLMVEFLRSHGIRAIEINGHQSHTVRHAHVERFKRDNSWHVLLTSGIGITGLNLTNATAIILFEIAWSSVLAQQAYGRIHRKGQKHPTLAIQLVAQNTVDVLFASIALNKVSLAQQFSTVERRREFIQPFMNALADKDHIQDFHAPDIDTGDVETFISNEKAQKRSRKKGQAPVKSKKGKQVVGLAPPADDDGQDSDPAPKAKPLKREKGKSKQEAPLLHPSAPPEPEPKNPQPPSALSVAMEQSLGGPSVAGPSSAVPLGIPEEIVTQQASLLNSVEMKKLQTRCNSASPPVLQSPTEALSPENVLPSPSLLQDTNMNHSFEDNDLDSPDDDTSSPEQEPDSSRNRPHGEDDGFQDHYQSEQPPSPPTPQPPAKRRRIDTSSSSNTAVDTVSHPLSDHGSLIPLT
ncbi:P-loop containing nucleoside triphosphate hydrolase protein [Mycena olivaceomarginata]|nr:P-loop containing nucleoside triphosphate hydrolase protein [Mycena olivaceomarginata]